MQGQADVGLELSAPLETRVDIHPPRPPRHHAPIALSSERLRDMDPNDPRNAEFLELTRRARASSSSGGFSTTVIPRELGVTPSSQMLGASGESSTPNGTFGGSCRYQALAARRSLPVSQQLDYGVLPMFDRDVPSPFWDLVAAAKRESHLWGPSRFRRFVVEELVRQGPFPELHVDGTSLQGLMQPRRKLRPGRDRLVAAVNPRSCRLVAQVVRGTFSDATRWFAFSIAGG